MIAKEAGISPGSLYQYFPNKEAIFIALVDWTVEQSQGLIQKRLIEVMSESLPVAARKMMATLVEVLESMDPALIRSLVEQVPHLRDSNILKTVRQHGLSLARLYLSAHRDELQVSNIDAAAFLVVNISTNIALRIAFDRPADLDRDVCLQEATDLFTRYLMKPVG